MGYIEANGIKYGKPSMTDLPRDLWDSIVDTMMNSPQPDFTKMNEGIAEFEESIRKERVERAEQGS